MPQAEPTGGSVFFRLLGISAILLAHFVALVCVMVSLCKIVPTYGFVFEQLDVAVPARTQQIFQVSQICLRQPLSIIFFVMLTDAAVVSALAFKASRKKWVLSTYSHIFLVAASVVLLYVGAWLSHPVRSLVE